MADRQETEQEFVAKLRYIAERLRGDRWFLETDDAGVHLISARSSDGEMIVIATFHPAAVKYEIDLVGRAVELLMLFLSVGERAARTIAKLKAAASGPDYTTAASIAISNPTFWRFLETRGAGGPVRDKTAADTRLKSILNFESKKDLNKPGRPRDAWRRLDKDFREWKGGAPR